MAGHVDCSPMSSSTCNSLYLISDKLDRISQNSTFCLCKKGSPIPWLSSRFSSQFCSVWIYMSRYFVIILVLHLSCLQNLWHGRNHGLVSVINSGEFSVIISSNISSACSLFLQVHPHYIWYCPTLLRCSFKTFFSFLLCVSFDWPTFTVSVDPSLNLLILSLVTSHLLSLLKVLSCLVLGLHFQHCLSAWV